MTFRAANSPLSPEAAADLDMFFAIEASGCNSWPMRQRREAEFARLHALPDAALAAMGLSRDRLARYVFREMFSR
ncbi:hypothetical protein L0V05_06490 [Tabrizicola sp. J26]|uniref:hypothetical protein n=1 Tax=Alitabrizicola rongguiensis TaxID=2909234 RepID=UPI001F3C4E34|nr:hypothetical protein [Tabrizicola rongguiensis]MCF1708461.1 hypothetical protein [Tabrizicola rongguiensis]